MACFSCRLCLITDFRFIPDNSMEEIIKSAIDGGADLILYRDKESQKKTREKRAARLRTITGQRDAALIIGGSVALARLVGAEGVHLGRGTLSPLEAREQVGPDMLIGASVHNENEIRSAGQEGADYLLLSPLFRPGSKESVLPPLGEERFHKLCQTTTLPVMALGGINQGNASIPVRCGARGVACVTGLLTSGDIRKAAEEITKQLG